MLALRGGLGVYVGALRYCVSRIYYDLVAVLQAGGDVDLSSQVAPDVDWAHLDDAVCDDGDKLASRRGNYAISRDEDAGIGRGEVQLH